MLRRGSFVFDRLLERFSKPGEALRLGDIGHEMWNVILLAE